MKLYLFFVCVCYFGGIISVFFMFSLGRVVAENSFARMETWELSVLLPVQGILPPSHLLTLTTTESSFSSILEENKESSNLHSQKKDVVRVTVEPLQHRRFRKVLYRIGEILGITARFPTPSFSSSLSLCPLHLLEDPKGDNSSAPLSFTGYWKKVLLPDSFADKTAPTVHALYMGNCEFPLLYFPSPVTGHPYGLDLENSWMDVQDQFLLHSGEVKLPRNFTSTTSECKVLPWKELGVTAVRQSTNSFVVIFTFEVSSSFTTLSDNINRSKKSRQASNSRCYLPIQGMRLEKPRSDCYFGSFSVIVLLLIVISFLRSKVFLQAVQGKLKHKKTGKPTSENVRPRGGTTLSHSQYENLKRRRDELILRMMEMDKEKKRERKEGKFRLPSEL